MANQTAILVQSSPGSEVVLDAGAHILLYEEGAAAAWAGVQLRTVASKEGIPEFEAYEMAVSRVSRYLPRCSLVCLENTHNTAGGRIVPVEAMASVSRLARAQGVKLHLDGARLPNASVALGRPMRDWAELADTVMVSLSKGLGAPVGSILAGSQTTIDEAWRVRRRLGGGMRQVGLLAAAGLHALRNNFDSLADDHRRARTLAADLARIPDLGVSEPETNIVLVDLPADAGTAGDVAGRLRSRNVLFAEFGPRRLRAVTHRDVSDEGIARAVSAVKDVLAR